MEHGVGALPKTEGRFPQISGLRVKFDSSKPTGKRVVSVMVVNTDNESCKIEKLDLDKVYTVATRAYLADGGDGYTAFTLGQTLDGSCDSAILSTILRRFLLGIKTLQQMKSSPKRQKSSSLAPQSKWKILVEKSLTCKRLKESKGFVPEIDVKVDGRIIDVKSIYSLFPPNMTLLLLNFISKPSKTTDFIFIGNLAIGLIDWDVIVGATIDFTLISSRALFWSLK